MSHVWPPKKETEKETTTVDDALTAGENKDAADEFKTEHFKITLDSIKTTYLHSHILQS